MKKLMAFLLPVVAVFGVLTACSPGAEAYNLNEQFILKPSGTARIGSEDLTITFEKVINDSRCATGVTCIWQGQVQALLTIELGNGKEQLVLTQPGLSQTPATQIYGSYEFTFDVTPYPSVGEPIKAADYRLELTVNRSQ